MSLHTVIGKFQRPTTDGSAVSSPLIHPLALVNTDGRIGFGVSQALTDLRQKGLFPTEVAIDLMILAVLVHAADTRVLRSESEDTWTREFHLVVPVSDITRWSSAAPLIQEMLRFLSGDLWSFEFVLRPENFQSLAGTAGERNTNLDCAALFSGGLDSLIGAIDLAEAGRRPLLISHSADGTTDSAQNQCFDAVHGKYSACDRARIWLSVERDAFNGGNSETTTRGRSFLFFSLASLAASGLGRRMVIYVPENGLISLNVPLDPLRLGSHSTRTTHPFYMSKWNQLLEVIGIEAQLENPYQYQTKGEMVANCRNKDLLTTTLVQSMSCSSPNKFRWQGQSPQHCGFCVPCIIRRAAINHALKVDPTPYSLGDLHAQRLSTGNAEGAHVRAFQLATRRLDADESLARILIHKTGPLTRDSEVLSRLAGVYRRGMSEVSTLLDGVIAVPN